MLNLFQHLSKLNPNPDSSRKGDDKIKWDEI